MGVVAASSPNDDGSHISAAGVRGADQLCAADPLQPVALIGLVRRLAAMNDTLDEVPLFFRTAIARSSACSIGRRQGPGHGLPSSSAIRSAEEKLWTHRVFVSYARQLAAAGYPVLRFDLTGHGDSEGSFSDASMATLCADLRRAIQEARRLTGVPP